MPEPEITPAEAKGRDDEFIETINPGPQTHPKPENDSALHIVNDLDHSPILTPQANSHVLRKIDLRLLPILLGIYFLQQLDKTTLSYASVFGLIEKAHLHGQQDSLLERSCVPLR